MCVYMSDNWATPGWLKNILIGYADPVPLNFNTDFFKSFEHLNGAPLFINPPYSSPMPFILRGIEYFKTYKVPVIFLLRADHTTAWYRELVTAGAHFIYIHERLRFSNKELAPFSSILAILTIY